MPIYTNSALAAILKMQPLFVFLALFAVQCISAEIPEPCDARLNGCVARNKALPPTIFAAMTQSDPNFRESDACPLVCYNDTGAQFEISHRFENPQVQLLGYLLHGSVEAEILGAPGVGVILSFYLQSDDKDEIDIAEIFGGNHLLFQTNYFSKGDVTTNGKGIYVGLDLSPLYNFHKYGVRWTAEEIEWTVDGAVVRHVRKEPGEGFPNSPMRVRFSLWIGGDPANEAGTITWSGGITDFAEAPFRMFVRNIRIDNAGGGTEYIYSNDQALVVHGVGEDLFFNGLATIARLSLEAGGVSGIQWAWYWLLMVVFVSM
ncbi:hypothetical protein PUMCH_001684 [Australozyma saopauloensis]|uniref:GH16 domain-containing protein n=1 Tax=Australozyma saopauloensis TaxID=291208 RepID=A0AAX4H872_9ASCO|nr:hypothetical protein PUMCH_001684 [[Candida] saopauloensis]